MESYASGRLINAISKVYSGLPKSRVPSLRAPQCPLLEASVFCIRFLQVMLPAQCSSRNVLRAWTFRCLENWKQTDPSILQFRAILSGENDKQEINLYGVRVDKSRPRGGKGGPPRSQGQGNKKARTSSYPV
jgi:hypothetical protein